MKSKFLLLIGFVSVLVTSRCTNVLAQEIDSTQTDSSRFQRVRNAIPNQYIVVFHDGVTWQEVRQIASEYKRRNRRILQMYGKVLNGFAIRLSEREAQELSQDERVKYVQDDALLSASQAVAITSCATAASDGHYPKCVAQIAVPWNLDRLNQSSTTLDNKFAWAGTGKNVNVYVVDTGILTTHVDFQGRASAAYNAVNDGNGSTDCNGHGTFAAGLIGGYTYGIAKEANLKSVRVLDCSGNGSTSNVIAGIDWITANAVRPAVANLSFGGALNTSIDNAVKASINAGIVYVIAAGNDNTDANNVSPARVTEAITVGAMDQNQYRASFSNYGTAVDFYAPGVNTYSAYKTSNTAQAIASGTSMAAPIIAGMAAVALEWNPDVNNVYSTIYTKLNTDSALYVNLNSSSYGTTLPSTTQTTTNNGNFKTFGIPIVY
jgi:aqualysin 1